MKTIWYENVPRDPNKGVVPLYGGYNALHTLHYILCQCNSTRHSGVEGWKSLGIVKDCSEYPFGARLSEGNVVGVCTTKTDKCVSDSFEKEREQIAKGKVWVILFYGCDNHSVMRRYTEEEYKSLVLNKFEPEDNDLFYNS